MDAINALDSSAPQPKKKRENKPQSKPPAKIDVQPPQSDKTSSDTVLVEDVTQTPAKSVKAKNRCKKTATLNSSNTMSPNSNAVDVRPLSPIQSPSKETLEENLSVGAHSEVKMEQKSKKKKKKKKKEKMTEDTEGENVTMENGINNKEEHKKIEVTDKNTCNSRVETKDGKGNDDGIEPIRNVEKKTESIVQQKKLKKKKKTNEEGLEQKTEGEINFEKPAEEKNIVQSKKAKKKKQKEKIDADSSEKTSREEEMQTGAAEAEENAGEENSEPISNERKGKKKRKHHEGNLKVLDEKRNFEEQKDQENIKNHSECTDDGEQTAEVNHKNKKCSSIKNDSMALSPLLPSHEMLGPPSEKRKSE